MPIDLIGLPHQYALWADTRMDFEIALVGPLGSGKSYGLAIKQFLLRMANPGCDGMLVVPTFPIARQIHLREWPDIWKKVCGVDVTFHRNDSAWYWPNGDATWLRSADEPERLVGANLSDVMFDEPGLIDELAYLKATARVRHPKAKVRQTITGGTPEGINWWAEMFENPEGRRHTIYAKEWHRDLAHYRDKLMELYGADPQLKKSYVDGRFTPLREGRCYPAFEAEKHVRVVEHDPRLPLVLACDFNVDAMRWVVMQFPEGEIRAIDEIALGSGSNTEKILEVFVKRWAGKHRGDLVICGDRSGKARSSHSSRTDYQIIMEECRGKFATVTRRVPPENPIVKFRIDNLNYHLGGRGRKVTVHPDCRELRKDFEQTVWKKGQPIEDQVKDRRRTHAAAACGYAAWMFARVLTTDGRTRAGLVSVGKEVA